MPYSDPEKRKAAQRRYYEKNKAEVIRKAAILKKANKDRYKETVKKYNREYYQKNKHRIVRKSRAKPKIPNTTWVVDSETAQRNIEELFRKKAEKDKKIDALIKNQ